ncbi:MAG TPA: hypothetical protein DCR97_03420 [Deltaproteobacteria bacterium]|nr:hypothetical protein [Deltaproteobacteria bacterium]
MGNKVYAVRKGRAPGIYDAWPECEAQIKGFSGAEFKSFGSTFEAQAWLNGSITPDPLATSQGTPAPFQSESQFQWASVGGEGEGNTIWIETDKDAIQQDTLSSTIHSSRATPQPGQPTTDYCKQLEMKAAGFLAYLQSQGILAYAAAGGSQYHERIGIKNGGQVDIYHTRKKPFSLVANRISDPGLRSLVVGYWQKFHWGVDPGLQSSLWDTVDYYYGLLKPYANLRFDFIALALVLRNASSVAPDPDEVRYDFASIESAYNHLRPGAS